MFVVVIRSSRCMDQHRDGRCSTVVTVRGAAACWSLLSDRQDAWRSSSVMVVVVHSSRCLEQQRAGRCCPIVKGAWSNSVSVVVVRSSGCLEQPHNK